jgi:hypothetical protein
MAKRTSKVKPSTRSKQAPARTRAAKVSKRLDASSGGGGRGATVRLLSGGNPQIAKGLGDGPVRAYIAAMPGWKRGAGRRIDRIITRAVPGVRKAVKWNSPLYGAGPEESAGWFLGIHCFSKYIKVAFFRGALLRPAPPVASRHKDVRYLHIHEDAFDETQFGDWVRQASRLPGERM